MERCKKLNASGNVCMSMDEHLMVCLRDILVNKVWPSLEFLKMARSSEIEMSQAIIDIVIKNLDEIVAWVNFLKEKGEAEHKKIFLIDEQSEAEGFARELSDALIVEKTTNRDFMQRLATLAEFRDSASGNHILRIGLYANKISEMLDLPMVFIDRITVASTLHDIGKMGVPADILFKPTPLTPHEMEMAKQHTVIGHSILSGSSSPIMEMAAEIALTHHENWDGSGYPNGQVGKQIPLSGMIVRVCDVYDALRSRRPYKGPYNHKKAVAIIVNGDVKTKRDHFSPDVLDAFIEISDVFEEIFDAHHQKSAA